jgi:serine/threonine protein kinase
LKHPNIVTYKESWEGGDGLLYIVMGFCEGGDLYRKLKEQKGQLLPESQVVEWFVQIAMALQVLSHSQLLQAPGWREDSSCTVLGQGSPSRLVTHRLGRISPIQRK